MTETMTNEKGITVVCAACGQRNRIPFERLGDPVQCGRCHAEMPQLAAPIDVRTVDEFDKLVAASLVPVLVDFWAPWCGPCRMVAPEMARVAAARAGRLVVAKVNTEEVPELAERFAVYSIPTMAVFAGGRQVGRTAGARPAQAIQAFVDEAVKGGG